MTELAPIRRLTDKDFASDQEPRWCPGCGDYAILKALQRTLAELGVRKERLVFISGIGCAARFPYHVAAYGFHTIHGRAPAVATGVKLANPDLDVWVITGDGDGLSIGGNHLLHILRRNVDVQILLFNNGVYGLTKGQYSPTSVLGQRTPSSPFGTVERPLLPCAFALGAGARFVARSVDTLMKHLPTIFKRARAFRGASFVEILQNCLVYNDKAFALITEKDLAPEHQIHLEHGQPLVFGREGNHALRLKPGGLELEVVTIGENGVTLDEVLVHDETDRTLAGLLAALKPPDFPLALGVLYCEPAPAYDESVHRQIEEVKRKKPADGLNALLRQGYTWTVEG